MSSNENRASVEVECSYKTSLAGDVQDLIWQKITIIPMQPHSYRKGEWVPNHPAAIIVEYTTKGERTKIYRRNRRSSGGAGPLTLAELKLVGKALDSITAYQSAPEPVFVAPPEES